MKRIYFATALALILTIADTVAKMAIITALPTGSVVLIPRVLSLHLHMNPGIIGDTPLPMILVIALSLAILAALALWLKKAIDKGHTFTATGIAILASGAIGNLTDRLAHGFTTDYIVLFETSIANISDGVILVGIVWLFLAAYKEPHKKNLPA